MVVSQTQPDLAGDTPPDRLAPEASVQQVPAPPLAASAARPPAVALAAVDAGQLSLMTSVADGMMLTMPTSADLTDALAMMAIHSSTYNSIPLLTTQAPAGALHAHEPHAGAAPGRPEHPPAAHAACARAAPSSVSPWHLHSSGTQPHGTGAGLPPLRASGTTSDCASLTTQGLTTAVLGCTSGVTAGTVGLCSTATGAVALISTANTLASKDSHTLEQLPFMPPAGSSSTRRLQQLSAQGGISPLTGPSTGNATPPYALSPPAGGTAPGAGPHHPAGGTAVQAADPAPHGAAASRGHAPLHAPPPLTRSATARHPGSNPGPGAAAREASSCSGGRFAATVSESRQRTLAQPPYLRQADPHSGPVRSTPLAVPLHVPSWAGTLPLHSSTAGGAAAASVSPFVRPAAPGARTHSGGLALFGGPSVRTPPVQEEELIQVGPRPGDLSEPGSPAFWNGAASTSAPSIPPAAARPPAAKSAEAAAAAEGAAAGPSGSGSAGWGSRRTRSMQRRLLATLGSLIHTSRGQQPHQHASSGQRDAAAAPSPRQPHAAATATARPASPPGSPGARARAGGPEATAPALVVEQVDGCEQLLDDVFCPMALEDARGAGAAAGLSSSARSQRLRGPPPCAAVVLGVWRGQQVVAVKLLAPAPLPGGVGLPRAAGAAPAPSPPLGPGVEEAAAPALLQALRCAAVPHPNLLSVLHVRAVRAGGDTGAGLGSSASASSHGTASRGGSRPGHSRASDTGHWASTPPPHASPRGASAHKPPQDPGFSSSSYAMGREVRLRAPACAARPGLRMTASSSSGGAQHTAAQELSTGPESQPGLLLHSGSGAAGHRALSPLPQASTGGEGPGQAGAGHDPCPGAGAGAGRSDGPVDGRELLHGVAAELGGVQLAVVMEYATMGNLLELSASASSPFQPRHGWTALQAQRALAATAAEVAGALAALHAAGLAHGALTPENVLAFHAGTGRRASACASQPMPAASPWGSPYTTPSARGAPRGGPGQQPSGTGCAAAQSAHSAALPQVPPHSAQQLPGVQVAPHSAQQLPGVQVVPRYLGGVAAAAGDSRGFIVKVADAAGFSGTRAALQRSGMPARPHLRQLFQAPEALLSEGAASTQPADVYSFGMLLHVMAAGHLPFQGQHHNLVELLVGVAADGLRPAWPPGPLHAQLGPLYGRCTAQEPAERPAFDQVLVELQRCAAQLASAAPTSWL